MTAHAHERALQAYGATYGNEPAYVSRAPGRVNLIGEHVDYSGGLVCPIAIDRDTVAVASPRAGRMVHVVSADRPGMLTFDLDAGGARRNRWVDYLDGMARALTLAGARLCGATIALASDVPIGAGLSSSAALEIAGGGALLAVAGAAMEPRALANAARAAENDFVGVQSGIMDQLISVLGERDHALLIDCRTQTTTAVAIPDGVAVVVADSGVRHALTEPGYNDRRAESDAAARALGMPLRDATLAEVGDGRLDALLARRARHVVSENTRVSEFAGALAAGDLARAGDAMSRSHRSLRDDYEVSIPALDKLVDAAVRMPGVYGARMTGGGFGGCIVALVAADATPAVTAALAQQATSVWVVHAADGASSTKM